MISFPSYHASISAYCMACCIWLKDILPVMQCFNVSLSHDALHFLCRLSFPSGHASLAAYCMVFLVVGRYEIVLFIFPTKNKTQCHVNKILYNKHITVTKHVDSHLLTLKALPRQLITSKMLILQYSMM